MIDPEKNPIVSNSIFVEAGQARRQISKRLRDRLRMLRKVVNLLHHAPSRDGVKFAQIPFETRRGLDPIDGAHRGQRSFLMSRIVKWYLRATGEGRVGKGAIAHRARLGDRAKSRLKSSHGRVLPESCSRRAFRSLRRRAGLCKIRKSSKASCNSSSASLARRNLLNNSVGTSTVWPILRSSA